MDKDLKNMSVFAYITWSGAWPYLVKMTFIFFVIVLILTIFFAPIWGTFKMLSNIGIIDLTYGVKMGETRESVLSQCSSKSITVLYHRNKPESSIDIIKIEGSLNTQWGIETTEIWFYNNHAYWIIATYKTDDQINNPLEWVFGSTTKSRDRLLWLCSHNDVDEYSGMSNSNFFERDLTIHGKEVHVNIRHQGYHITLSCKTYAPDSAE